MSRTTKTITVSLPPDLVAMMEDLCREEGRTRSELLREALRRYAEGRQRQRLYRYAETKAKETGITEDQVEDIVDAYRR